MADTSSVCYLCLPDSLISEMNSMAFEGFKYGFGIGTACLLACGMITVVLYLINRGAGH